jgi:hypothetical protein
VALRGGRLFGIGFRQNSNKKEGHQILRIDYHRRQTDPRFVHDPRYIGNIRLDSGTTLHWQVPETAALARVRWSK